MSELKAAAKTMIDIVFDEESSDVEKRMATSTLIEILHPSDWCDLDDCEDAQEAECECMTWARVGVGACLWLKHHPGCQHYRPEPEIRSVLLDLIDGIELWASDEDGVHPACWDAYSKACGAVGQWFRAKASE
jgi:hypothetical protein